MKEIMMLLSRFLFTCLNSLEIPKGVIFIRSMAHLTAFFLLVLGYALGCRALYHHLKPQSGEIVSLLVIGSVLLVTSLFLFAIAWLLKPKPSPSTNLISIGEKILREASSEKVIKKIESLVSLKSLISVFAIAAIYSYFTSFKKGNTEI